MPVAVAAIYAVTPLLGFDVSESASWVVLIPFACLSAGLYAPPGRRFAGFASTMAALGLTLAGLVWLTDFAPSVLFGLIFSVGPWALGVALQAALERNRCLGAEAEQARIERAAAAERAASAERTRIADELRDVLAHTLAAMVVQTAMANDLMARDAAAAARVLRRIEDAGREALAETGHLLRVIRDEQPPSIAAHGRVPAPQGTAVRGRDTLLPRLFSVIGAVEVVANGYAPVWASVAAFWLAAGVLCARRRVPAVMPVAVAAIGVGAGFLGAETDEPAAWVLLYGLACHAAGAYLPRTRLVAGGASVAASIALIALPAIGDGGVTWDAVFVLAFAVVPWAVGVALREAFERGGELAAEAEQARAERALEAERGATAERRRIARELHDMLANALSVMVVQAALAAELAEAGQPAQRAAAATERAGRTALNNTSRLLRLLRDGEADIHPRRGVADLPALADDYARAGLGVELEVGAIRRLPAGVELSTYRIVQEGLTNALKHAPGSPGAGAARPDWSGGRDRGAQRLRRKSRAQADPGRPRPARPARARQPFRRAPRCGRNSRDAPGGRMTSVVLADDQELVRSGLRALLEARGIDVLAEAEHGRAAVEAARLRRPDVLLMDIRMPVMDGIAATREVVAAQLSTRILILTTYDLDEYVYEALRAGAAGFLLKAAPADRLVEAIDVVARGEALLAPTVVQRLIAEHVRRPPPTNGVPEALRQLTERELEVLALIARGLANDEIAAELVVSLATVKTHVNRILAKLGLRSRAQAVVTAYETGLVRPGDATP